MAALQLDLLETRPLFNGGRGGLPCDSDGRKNVEEAKAEVEEEQEEGGCEEGAAAAIVSAFPLVCLVESNDVCPVRRTCGHCTNIELGKRGGVINVSAGELRATEGGEVSRSLAVSGLSMHTTGVTPP